MGLYLVLPLPPDGGEDVVESVDLLGGVVRAGVDRNQDERLND